MHAESGNMPEWTEGTAATFWKAADAYERANGAAYREHVIALPNELSLEQNRALAVQLARELVGSKPFQIALHAPQGTLGGITNLHMHLMFSDRVPDGISRGPERMFARYNSERPEDGGCRKDRWGQVAHGAPR